MTSKSTFLDDSIVQQGEDRSVTDRSFPESLINKGYSIKRVHMGNTPLLRKLWLQGVLKKKVRVTSESVVADNNSVFKKRALPYHIFCAIKIKCSRLSFFLPVTCGLSFPTELNPQ